MALRRIPVRPGPAVKARPGAVAPTKVLRRPGAPLPGSPTSAAANTIQRPKGAVRGRTTAGFQNARAENQVNAAEAARRRETPFRFRMKVGEERVIILLDEKPFFTYEHHWEGKDGKWNQFCVCIKDSDTCPACATLGKEGYYAMMLTCIDCTPFTDRNQKKHKFSRKLLPVKSTMIPKFERLYKKNDESFKGIVLKMMRENARGTNIGDDFEEMQVLEVAQLAKYKDDQGKPLKVVDYDKAFPQPTKKELQARFGKGKTVGGEETEAEEENLEVTEDVDSSELPF